MSVMIDRRRLLAGAGAMGVLMSDAKAAGGERFSALALQTVCDAVNQDKTAEAARARMLAAVGRVKGQVAASKGFLKSFNGYDLNLVVLPEYWMTGFPLRETREEWQDKAVIDVDGEIEGQIAAIAKTFGVYLCSNHYENDANFPDLYFQANVVYAPSGEAVLRYRRMISLYSPTPYDVWDQYLKIYGEDGVFPVVDTEIGRIGTVASEEILYPEVARMLGLKGAELILHPTSEVGAPGLTPKDVAKRARALENIAYVISANSAGIEGTPVPTASTDLMSKIVDWKGAVVAEAGPGETMNANAVIDLDGLRSARRRTGMSNFMSRLPLDAFRAGYGETRAKANRTADGKMIERADAIAHQQAVIDDLAKRGLVK
ncbi:MAG: nitrilase-related carbon-nitrogen hydrolase [Pseudomonadota bacterium]